MDVHNESKVVRREFVQRPKALCNRALVGQRPNLDTGCAVRARVWPGPAQGSLPLPATERFVRTMKQLERTTRGTDDAA